MRSTVWTTCVVLARAGVFAVRARLGLERDRGRLQSWRNAARECGLTDLQPGPALGRGATLTGRAGSLRVRFQSFARMGESGTRIVVDGPTLVALSLRREGLVTDLGNRFVTRELQIGDPAFDAQFYVRGPHLPVRAVLTDKTRRLLSFLLQEAHLEIANGQIRVDIPRKRRGGVIDRGISRILPVVLDASRRLERPGDVARRLADNARVDSEPGVRLENLLALAYECPGDPNTRVALHRACADRSHEIRVRAAAILGEDGRHTLIELVFAKRVEDKWAAQALTELKGHLPPGTVKEILNRALHRRRVETARACLATLGTGGWPEGVAMLASVMAREEGELAVVAAQALGQYGIGGAEEPLVMALARDAPRLRVAAAEALGRVGSPAAVAPLKEAEARHGDDSAFRRVARQAIAEIQSRMTGASPGQLSLALSAASGKLSLVPDEKGRLSLDQPRR